MPKSNITFDLASISEALKAFILKHQGEKGFINTKCIPETLIRNYDIDDEYYSDDEVYVKYDINAVRVKDNKIEIISRVCWWSTLDDEEVAEMEDNEWDDICDRNIITVYTLLSIAENIEKFVKD